MHELRDLILCQPLEILQAERAGREISLTSHDTRLHEEGLLAVKLSSSGLVRDGFAVVEDVMSGGVVADHPGVHVDAGRLGKGAFGSLFQARLVQFSIDSSKHVATYLAKSLFCLHR